MEIKMTKYLVAFSVLLYFAGSASPILAQYSAQSPAQNPEQSPEQNMEQRDQARDAATSQCITTAQSMYPDNNVNGAVGRTATYNACMNSGGFKP